MFLSKLGSMMGLPAIQSYQVFARWLVFSQEAIKKSPTTIGNIS
ncbi:hypothetical protein Sez_1824 [Streptococcus equi subsp. zooepidemicus MGCS10565]|uniref:Uncharacterized protein n=1 Tax=Streptococcus equi subsp. zooepidemicus (strain MGCS10565) TaxID=552526 RepID=B4U5E0_STREM|nr:hypothetical protein Sez_1824 [Streptococcus equi subsp. zooepidemicus MGCS10565]